MNCLNSLIIEGVVSGEPHYEELGGAGQVTFTTVVPRYYKNRAGEGVEEKSSFKVIGFGSMCSLRLVDGAGVRIVGRLKQNIWTDSEGVSHSEVQIVAEHIEVRKSK